MKKFTGTILSVLFATQLMAQNIQIDQLIGSGTSYYEQLDSFTLITQVRVYKGLNSREIDSQLDGKVYCNKNKLRVSYPEMEILCTETLSLKCIHMMQTIYMGSGEANIRSSIEYMPVQDFLDKCSSTSAKIVLDKIHVVLQFDSNALTPYSKMELWFDSVSYRLSKQIVYYAYPVFLDGYGANNFIPRIEVEYTALNTQPQFPSGIFDPESLLKKTDAGYTGTGIYKDYAVQVLN